MSKEKTCSKCKSVHFATDEYFNRRKDSKDGRNDICKKCIKLYKIKNRKKIAIKQ